VWSLPDQGVGQGPLCEGPWRIQRWSTQLVDARYGQLLDVVEGRDAAAPAAWLAERGPAWLARIQWGVLDLSGPYRAMFDTMLPDAEPAMGLHVGRSFAIAGETPIGDQR